MPESEEQQHQQSSDFPTVGYEAAEEERQSLKDEEERNASIAGREEEEQKQQSPEPATQQKRGESGGGGKRRSAATAIGAATSAWQITLFDLDKQLNKQRMLMERMADDIKHLRKQFNQVQRDLAKFEKRMQKMKSAPSSIKRGKRRG
jgi:uncharacterized coiled-coil protein SlyX